MTAVTIFLKEFTKPGDGVVLQTPIYYPFYDVIEGMGRKILRNPMIYKDGKFYMDFEDLEEKFKMGAKVFVLCNPHNPVGRVWTKEEIKKVVKFCEKHCVQIISDEAHADFSYGESKYIPYSNLSLPVMDIYDIIISK